MSKHHRFTGRELTTLLEQVREELGSEATIVEAHKVRTGGIAGFFKNEKFEVIATPSDDDTIDLDERPVARAGFQLDLVEPVIATGAAQKLVASADDRDTVDIRTATISSTENGAARNNTANAAAALLERVDTITINDRIGLSRPPVDRSPKPTPAPELRFGDILSSELEQPEIELEEPAIDLVQPEIELEEPEIEVEEPQIESAQPEMTPRTSEVKDFWTHLEEAEGEVDPLDLDSDIIAVIGNRSSALAVARRIGTARDGETRALVAITSTPDQIELPKWQQVENESDLGDRLTFWQDSGRQGIVIIDVDFGASASALVERVRQAGSRVLRMAIDDELSPERIIDLMERLGGNVVIDLTFRAGAEYVLSLAGRGVPLASVGGHAFDANLLLALKREAQRG